jgi:hypothetical protein
VQGADDDDPFIVLTETKFSKTGKAALGADPFWLPAPRQIVLWLLQMLSMCCITSQQHHVSPRCRLQHAR